MKEKIGAAVLASALAVSGSGIAETNELIDKLLVTPDPIVETGVMSSQRELDLTSQQEKEEVDKRFTEFLSGEGEYSDESLERKLFRRNYFLDLGFIESGGVRTVVDIQSVLLFHKNINGEEILAIGIKDKEGRRKITVVDWPIRSLMSISSYSSVIVVRANTSYSSLESRHLVSEEMVGSVLDEKIDSVLGCTVDSNPKSYITGTGGKAYETSYRLLFSNKTNVNRQFLASIWRAPKKELSLESRKLFDSLKGISNNLLNIDSWQEFMDIANNNKGGLPYITMIYSRS